MSEQNTPVKRIEAVSSATETSYPIHEVTLDALNGQFESLARSVSAILSPESSQAHIPTIQRDFDTLRQMVVATAQRLEETERKTASQARAQAEAIVHSAEIIEELEETKLRLNEARAFAERAVTDTQQLADTIFSRTNDAVLILLNGYCISLNENAKQLFNVDGPNAIGSWPTAFTADSLMGGSEIETLIRSTYQDAFHGSPGSIEVAFRRDSKVVWCELKMTGFVMHETQHVLATACDITARKRLERELRRHRDFLTNIINAVPDPLSVSDANHKLVIANDSFCSSFGFERERVLGRRIDEIFPSQVGASICQSETAALQANSTTEEERVEPKADGDQRIHSVRRSAFEDRVSGDQYVVAVSRDITLDRRHQERLRLLASVFNNAAEGVAILSKHGAIIEANPRLIELFQCDSEVIGRHIAEIANFDAIDFNYELSTVGPKDPWSGKVATITADGDKRWFWLSLSTSESNSAEAQTIALFSDVTQLEDSQRQLQRQALYDNVTGLPNRRFFRKYVDELIAEHSPGQKQFTMCFMDLDDFKTVNDSLGHGTGDQLLIEVAARMTRIIGPKAFIARFGGDEFAAVFPHRRASDDDLAEDGLVQQLIDSFQDPISLGQNEATVGISVGVANFPLHGQDADTLMGNADIAMYAAKAAGKNHARLFSPEMQARADQRHHLQAEMRKMLQGGGISLAFQPKVSASTRQAQGCEVLARWQRADGTMVPPSEFIPIAEQSGFIVLLGELVLGKTLETCRDWKRDGIDLFPVAINISPQQLRSVHFVDRLMGLLKEYDADPSWLELEITENAVVEDINHAIETINQLHELGFRIAIDDFGTGYSSLSYLRFFQISTLKIDRSFVSEITTDRNCAAIAQSVVSLGHGLELTIVAEGVETEEQLEFLAEIGCDSLQGYFIGRPMPKDQIEEWQRNNRCCVNPG